MCCHIKLKFKFKYGIQYGSVDVRYMLSPVRLTIVCLSVCLSVYNARAPYSAG